MRGWLALALLLPLGGCISDVGVTEGVEESTLPPIDWAWRLTGCEGFIALFDVDPSQVEPHLPAGFATMSNAEGISGVAANPMGTASFGMEVFLCDLAVAHDGLAHKASYASYFAFVEPPSDLARDDVDAHFVKWDTVVPGAYRAGVLQDYGAPIDNGTATIAAFTANGPQATAQGFWTLANGERHDFAGESVAPGPERFHFVEFTPARSGLVVWESTSVVSAGGIGQGTVNVAAGTLAADVLGPGLHDATMMVVANNFESGHVGFLER